MENSSQPDLLQARSVRMGKFVVFLLILCSAFGLGLYYGKYFMAFGSGDASQMLSFWDFSQAFLTAVPFAIVVFLFLLGLFVFSFYVDLFNRFPRFDLKPSAAMFWVILPVLNVYGLGIVFARVINFLDDYHAASFKKENRILQLSLIIFYACLLAIMLSWILGMGIPSEPELFFHDMGLVIAGMQILAITLTIISISNVVLSGTRIVSKQLEISNLS